MFEKTQEEYYHEVVFYQCTELELNIKKGKIIAEILDLCYDKQNGIYWFFKFILGDLTYAGYPQPLFFNKLWKDWTKISQKGDHIAIVSSRQVGKSSYWALIMPLYRISMYKHYNILIESASEDQATTILDRLVKVIESNEFLLSKKVKDAKWASAEIGYNGGKIVAKGVGSEVRGGTYDLVIADDILRSDNKFSDDAVESFIDEELEPMILVRKGQIIIVGTKMTATDIFTVIEDRIREGSMWQIHYFPAILDWTKQTLLCPDRFTWEQLMNKRSVMGRSKFDKEFMCISIASGSQVFSYELRQKAMTLGQNLRLHSSSTLEDDGKWYYYMGVDCARAGTASADFTVAIVLAFNPHNNQKRIAYIWREKGLKISEQVIEIARLAQAFRFPPILVEKNNIGQEFIDLLVDNYNLHVEAFTTTKTSKEDIIRFLITTMENDKMFFPTGDEYSRDVISDLDYEMERFIVETTKTGNERMKGSGKTHDDQVIALALANKCSQSYGYTPFADVVERKTDTQLEMFAESNDPMDIFRL